VRTTFNGLYGVDSPLPTAWLDDIAQQREGMKRRKRSWIFLTTAS
jgi:predicted component of type VI protein secretion system